MRGRDAGALIQGRLWVIATAGTAIGVFFVAFLAVSAAIDDSTTAAVDASVTEVISEPTSPDPIAAVVEAPMDEAEDAETQSVEPDPDPLPETALSDTPAPPAIIPEPTPDITRFGLPLADLPEFDEDTLIHGGNGAQGAILAGSGIVRSSGVDRRTDWELLVPSARLRADIVRVGPTPINGFGAPDNPETIGWWETGPEPGEPGNVLLDGHVDFTDINGNVGTGVCWRLRDTSVGDAILVRDNAAGVYFLYEVSETLSVVWNSADGVAHLRQTDDSRLTLITCEGSFDGDAHNYSNRRIVVAQLVGVIPS